MKLYYEGVDITASVSVKRCEHETFSERRSDRLSVCFNDAKSLWDKWKPMQGQKVRIVEGGSDTGVMYITGIMPENGLFTLRAMSMPLSGETVNSRSWEDVRLHQIGATIAAAHGIKFQSYKVTDRLYSYLQQAMETDFEFLHRLCQLEGCAMVIYDETLIIYDEHQMEMEAASATIKIGVDGRFSYSDDYAQAYGSAEIVCGAYCGTYKDPRVNTGRILRPKKQIFCSSNGEAGRFARGLLRQANKNARTGSFVQKLTPGIAAASVINIKTDKASNWDGKVFVTRVRHEYVTGETKVFFRRPLEGY